MNVYVMSRKEAINYCYRSHDNPSVIISISDPYIEYSNSPFISSTNNVKAVLRLMFSDAEEPGCAVAGSGRECKQVMVGESDLMTDEDAIKIKQFVNRHKDKDIIVHCDAGISRSSGVAAAILKYLFGDDSSIFENPMYCPNMLCYRKTLEALYI